MEGAEVVPDRLRGGAVAKLASDEGLEVSLGDAVDRLVVKVRTEVDADVRLDRLEVRLRPPLDRQASAQVVSELLDRGRRVALNRPNLVLGHHHLKACSRLLAAEPILRAGDLDKPDRSVALRPRGRSPAAVPSSAPLMEFPKPALTARSAGSTFCSHAPKRSEPRHLAPCTQADCCGAEGPDELRGRGDKEPLGD